MTAEFSASLLHSSVSHDPSKIILICSEIYILNLNVVCKKFYFEFYFKQNINLALLQSSLFKRVLNCVKYT